MKVISEELNPCTVSLTVTVEKEKVKEAFGKAVKEFSKNVKVPGFRPGTAPRSMVEKYLDRSRIQQRATEIVISRAYQEALTETNLKPFGQPLLDLEQVDEDAELIFKLKVPLEPKVELGEYKGLSAKKPEVNVTDEEVEQQIEQLRSSKAKSTKIEDRAAETGDQAVITLTSKEGESNSKKFLVQIGETFGALDQAMGGMKPGETKELTLTFPSDFQDVNWAGKPMDVQLTLDSIQGLVLPELNDEFAKSFGGENIEDLKQKAKEEIQLYKERSVESQMEEELMQELMSNSTVLIPDTMWERKAEEQIEAIENELKENKSSFEMYATELQMTTDQLKAQIRSDVKQQITRFIAVQDIAKKEDLKVLPEELMAEVKDMARSSKVAIETMTSHLDKTKGWDEVVLRVVYHKTLKFLLENATLTK